MTAPLTKNEAREQIIRTVNRHILRRHTRRAWRRKPEARLLGMRHIQEAVCIARRNSLVAGDVLEAAGFRAVKR